LQVTQKSAPLGDCSAAELDGIAASLATTTAPVNGILGAQDILRRPESFLCSGKG
jgi:hypothetical protein